MSVDYCSMETEDVVSRAIALVSEDDTVDESNCNSYDENGRDGNDMTAATDNSNAICIQELSEADVTLADRKKLALYQKWLPYFEKDGIALQDDRLVCTICRKQVSADKKSRLQEHITSKKHLKMLDTSPEERPSEYEAFTPNVKRLKLTNSSFASSTKTYSKSDGRDKSHEILLADTLNLFVQLDVPFEKLNSDVWQTFVKTHVKNGELILKNFSFYKSK